MKSPAVSPDISHRSEHQTLVDTHFDLNVAGWRDVYDQINVHGAIYRKRLEIVLEWIDELAIPGGEKVLEIGCGSGRCTVALAQRGYLVHAMDSVAGMVDSTRERVGQAGVKSSVSIGLGDAHHLAFRDGSFGLVLAIGVMPYLHSPQKALSEMARVLKPGGFLLMTAGNRWRLKRILDPWFSPPMQPARKVIKAILRCFRNAQPHVSWPADSWRANFDQVESPAAAASRSQCAGREIKRHGPYRSSSKGITSQCAVSVVSLTLVETTSWNQTPSGE